MGSPKLHRELKFEANLSYPKKLSPKFQGWDILDYSAFLLTLTGSVLSLFKFYLFGNAGLSVADREASLELIKLDISRTFPSLYIFQKVRFSNQFLTTVYSFNTQWYKFYKSIGTIFILFYI